MFLEIKLSTTGIYTTDIQIIIAFHVGSYILHDFLGVLRYFTMYNRKKQNIFHFILNLLGCIN